jgi:hypothetical protein
MPAKNKSVPIRHPTSYFYKREVPQMIAQQQKPPKGTITVTDAQRRTNYSRQQLYNLIRAEKVKVSRRGWEYWIVLASLERYCRERGKALSPAE